MSITREVLLLLALKACPPPRASASSALGESMDKMKLSGSHPSD